MHVILGKKLGFQDEVDHKDRNKLNNCRTNLREATSQLNKANRTKKEGTSSVYMGVTLSEYGWKAQITVAYVNHHLGYFRMEADAAIAYNAAATKAFGEFAALNQI